MEKQRVQLKFDGRYEDLEGENRQWTILTDFFDKDGCNRRNGSFSLHSLKELGIVP